MTCGTIAWWLYVKSTGNKHRRTRSETMMEYKGYLGKADYDYEAKIFHGEVIGLKDVITFQGRTVDELEQAFKDSINDYLAWCKERTLQSV